MFSKLALLAAVPIALAACNSITGTQQEKQCLDDLRAVRITCPGNSSIFPGPCVIAWEIDHVCGFFTVEVLLSFDFGRSWQSSICDPGDISIFANIPTLPVGKTIFIKVIVRDPIGALVDMKQVFIGQAPRPRRHPDQQRD